jgi:ATP-binding cassette subfamily B protein
VSPARLLLLDEPTASLDAESAAGVIVAFQATRTDRTSVIVTP